MDVNKLLADELGKIGGQVTFNILGTGYLTNKIVGSFLPTEK